MTILLDANVLIALVVPDHVHHPSAATWFANLDEDHATCPITQGALLRFGLRHGSTVGSALGALASVTRHARHEFWPDSLGYAGIPLAGVIGHRQVTDAYLAALARHHQGRLATFDDGLAALHADITLPVPR